ncbi:hypothetical protein [Halpernia sp. GG3]
MSNIIRVPTGAYGGGGPYHSGCVESILCDVLKELKLLFPQMQQILKDF